VVQPPDPPRVPRRLLHLRRAAQPQHRTPPRLRRAHAEPHVLLHLQLEMEAQLLLPLAVLAATTEQRTQALADLGNKSHRPALRCSGPNLAGGVPPDHLEMHATTAPSDRQEKEVFAV